MQNTVIPIFFCRLKYLDVFDLSRNEIKCVPSEVAGLHITELNLNQNQITELSSNVADCPRLKTIRLQENCLQLQAIHSRILTDSKVSNMSLEGNLFEMKQLHELNGYEAYMERYTAVKKKFFWKIKKNRFSVWKCSIKFENFVLWFLEDKGFTFFYVNTF